METGLCREKFRGCWQTKDKNDWFHIYNENNSLIKAVKQNIHILLVEVNIEHGCSIFLFACAGILFHAKIQHSPV